MSDRPNLAPADELAAVTEQRKALEERENELKRLMITDPSARTGNNFVAIVKEISTRRLAQQTLKECYPEVYDACLMPATDMRVETHRIDHETGEIISLRRKPKLHTIRVIPGGSAA